MLNAKYLLTNFFIQTQMSLYLIKFYLCNNTKIKLKYQLYIGIRII